MDILEEGKGELLGFHDPDEQRAWIAANKSTALVDKRMTVKEAVERFIPDGCYIASGGFGHIRVAMSIIYEIIRQKRRNLAIAGKTAVHDLDTLIGAGCVSKVEAAYSFGHELRGLSAAGRRARRIGAGEGRRRDVERRLPVALPRGHDGRAVRPGAKPPRHRHAEVLVREGRRSIPSPESPSPSYPPPTPTSSSCTCRAATSTATARSTASSSWTSSSPAARGASS